MNREILLKYLIQVGSEVSAREECFFTCFAGEAKEDTYIIEVNFFARSGDEIAGYVYEVLQEAVLFYQDYDVIDGVPVFSSLSLLKLDEIWRVEYKY